MTHRALHSRTYRLPTVLVLAAILLVAGTATVAWAQSGNQDTIDSIVSELMEAQGVRSVGNIDPNSVDSQTLEELGEAVMEEMAGDEDHAEWMEQMMGGEGSPSLTEAHRWMGYRYLQSGGNTAFFGWGPGMMGPGTIGPRNMGPGMMGYGWRGRGRGPDSVWLAPNRGRWGPYGEASFGMPVWGWIVGAILFIIIIVLVVAVIRLRHGYKPGKARALDILRERYVQGDISQEEFRQMKEDLR